MLISSNTYDINHMRITDQLLTFGSNYDIGNIYTCAPTPELNVTIRMSNHATITSQNELLRFKLT